jgi:hypothetical protein
MPRSSPGWAVQAPGGDESLSEMASYLSSGTGADAGRRLPQGREPGLMADEEYQPVAVSRRISAPAHDIFRVLASPARHQEVDGSAMLRGAVSAAMIAGVGDVLVRSAGDPGHGAGRGAAGMRRGSAWPEIR